MTWFTSKLYRWLVGSLWPPNIKKMQAEKDISGLTQALEHPRPRVRWEAMRALGELWNIPALIDLGHDDLDTRAQAVETLGQLGDARVLKPLIASLQDPAVLYDDVRYTYPVRVNAIETLGKIGDPSAIEFLLDALRKRSWGYPMKGSGPLYASLARMGEPVLKPLITLLGDRDRHMRELAIFALGYLGDPRAVEPLGNVLEREADYLLKRAAAQSLYKIRDQRVVPVLIAALEREENAPILLDLVSFLCRMSDRRVIRPLSSVLQKADQVTRKRMIDEISRFGTAEALVAIEEYQKHTNFEG